MLLGIAAAPVGIALTVAPTTATAALATSALAAVLFLAAATMLYLDWLVRRDTSDAWLVAAMVLVACQLLGSAALALDPLDAAQRRQGWPAAVDLVVIAVVAVLILRGLRARSPLSVDPLLVGLALGVLGTVAKVSGPSVREGLPVAPVVLTPVAGTLLCVLAWVVRRHQPLPTGVSWRLGTALALVGVAHVASSANAPDTTPHLLAALALLGGGVLWTSSTFVLVRTSLEESRHRATRLQSVLLDREHADRGTREALHELRSTISGLAKASRLLADSRVSADARHRMEEAILHELERMERRLCGQAVPRREVSLDQTLDAVLNLHRAQGRVISWTPSGARVVGQPDAIAEALNILLENAATHGDAAGQVDVTVDDEDAAMVRIEVTDDGPGVPAELEERIFEWGERGPRSAGQGIGLNLARRLVTEQGGTLTLSEVEHGSSFAIRLPAARVSEEDGGGRIEQPSL